MPQSTTASKRPVLTASLDLPKGIREGVTVVKKRRERFYKYRGVVIGADLFGDMDAEGSPKRTWYVSKLSSDSFKRKIKFSAAKPPEFATYDEAFDWIDSVLDAKPQKAASAKKAPALPPAPPTPAHTDDMTESIKVSAFDPRLIQKVKSKGPEKPEGAATIRTFEQFERTLNSFAKGVDDPNGFKFLLIIGKGGKGKSECVRTALETNGYEEGNKDRGYGYTRNKLTGINCYKFLYEYRNLPIVLDDINSLLKEKDTPSLIQAATETRLPRQVNWRSNHADIGYDEDQTPPVFKTTSPIVIIANEWSSANHVIKSIETRAYTLYFNPSNEEVHSVYVPKWFGKTPEEREVYDYIGEWLPYIPNLHCRNYTTGRTLRHTHPDTWKEELSSILVPDELYSEFLALKLLNDTSFKTDKERIEEFVRRGAGSGITFKRIKAELGLSRQNRTTEGEDGRKTRWQG